MLVDTTLLIDFLKGEKNAVSMIEELDDIYTTEINAYELLVGANLIKNNKERYLKDVLILIDSINILPLEREGTIKAAEISSELIMKGKMIEETDALIAGIAISFGIKEIITANVSHFE